MVYPLEQNSVPTQLCMFIELTNRDGLPQDLDTVTLTWRDSKDI